ncbi:HdeD family acid-resistance protein [Nocardia sp. NPDC052566]|uniref:HdeD family acid-resistance protein n=1 Tax=Nocardia sp. NPDC052566 TaxID=3364330 RepID=UPI0037C9EE65
MPANEDGERVHVLGRGVRQTVLLAGICSVVLGVVIAVWPDKTIAIAQLLIGLSLVLSGALQMVLGLTARIAPALRVMAFFSGMVSVTLGVLCLNGNNSILLLEVWIGLGWVFRGITQATVAVWTDDLPEAGRQELFGLCTLVVGVAIILVEINSLTLLGVVVGLTTIALGATELLTVASVRQDGIHLPGSARIRWPAAGTR